MAAIKVLVVDDSAVMRALLREMIREATDLEVVGEAADAFEARERIKALNPDVITLDVEMPRMNGLRFLENLMRLRPTPVVMFSSLTAAGAQVTLQAFALGAVEVLQKPAATTDAALAEAGERLRAALRVAARARPRARSALPTHGDASPKKMADGLATARRFCLVGASTGGTEAIRDVLSEWAVADCAVLIVQHIPAAFSAAFAERLDRNSPLFVRHATDGQPLQGGHAYVAPGGRHMRLARMAGGFCIRLGDDAPVNRHRPSADVLFESALDGVRDCFGAALLTGMGEDGARGLLQLREAGVSTVVQDEASSVVWGMPGSAVRLGAADKVLPLSGIAAHLAQLAARRPRSISDGSGRYNGTRMPL